MAAVTDHGAEAAGQLLLSSASLERFFEEGYVCLEGIMDAEHCEAVKRDIDALMLRSERDEPGGPSRRAVHVAEMPTLGALTVFEPVVRCVGQLMEAASEQAPEAAGLGTFSFHHQHAARLDAGAGPADWHMDYEQFPQVDRELLMVHCFFYPNGLDGQVGDLMVQPRSHKVVMDRGRDVFGHLFGDDPLPGSVIFDNLGPGSVVIVHSALMHARRAKPGGEGRPRYFSDLSYCQHSSDPSHRWPSYQVASRRVLGASGGHGEVYDAHRAHRRHETAAAVEKGVFSALEATFWDTTNANPTQLRALDRAPANRPPAKI